MGLSHTLKSLLIAMALAGCATTAQDISASFDDATVTSQTIHLSSSNDQQLELLMWQAPSEHAIVVFSAGGGGQPSQYNRMLSALAAKGFTVVAPVHNDALARGDLSGSNGPDSFAARIEDLARARGFAKSTRESVPIIVAGHSFGTMTSSIAVGSATPAGPQTDPEVKALIAFSSPGVIPGLLTRDTYASVAVPVLMVTGDKDVVPGFVSDWHDHRLPYDTSKASGSMLVIVEGADHNLIVNAHAETFDYLTDLTATFIEANVLDNKRASAVLDQMIAPAGMTVEQR